MSKEFYDKYGKLVDCFNCNCIEPCSKGDSPLCSEGYVFFAKDKIADLEAKLADMQNEKDELISKYRYWRGECVELKEQLAKEQKHVSRLKNMNKSHDEAVGRLTEENNQLKQQLAEKDQQIESYKHTIYMNMLNQEMLELKVATQDQDKISFAVEQINKLKNDLYENEKINIRVCDFDEIDNIFETQINQLKEMK